MPEYREGLRYSSEAQLNMSSAPAVLPHYASVDAMLAALNVNGVVASFIDFDDRSWTGALAQDDAAPLRVNLLMGVGFDSEAESSDSNVDETIYVVTPTELDGKRGVRCEAICTVTWQSANAALISPTLGGRANEFWASTATVNATGLCASRGGAEPVAGPEQVPMVVTLFDCGNMLGILRVTTAGAATPAFAFSPMHERWR